MTPLPETEEAPEELPKTYKREVSLGCLVVLYIFLGLGVWGFDQAMVAGEMLLMPTFALVAGTFGLHSYATQLKK